MMSANDDRVNYNIISGGPRAAPPIPEKVTAPPFIQNLVNSANDKRKSDLLKR